MRELPRPNFFSVRKQLPNGVVIRAAQREGTAATVFVRLGFGSKFDPPDRPGLALLAARLLTADVRFRTELDRLGARVTATAEEAAAYSFPGESSDIEIRCASEALPAVLNLIGQALTHHAFTPDDLERVREDMRSDIEALADYPAGVAREAAMRAAVPGWRPAVGPPASLNQARLKDVSDFFSAHLAGGGVLVGIVAQADISSVFNMAARAFSGIRSSVAGQDARQLREPPKEEKTLNESLLRVPMPGKTRVEIAAAAMGPLHRDTDVLPMRLLNYVLGETGYSGRLGRALVEPGLVYEANSIQARSNDATILEITTATAPADLDATLAAIRRELKSLSGDGVEDWELQEAKAYSLGRMVFALEQDPARILLDSEYFGEDLLDFPARSAKILAVTREDLNRVARRYYDPARFHFGLAGAVK
jgi:zinc protease